MANPPVKCMLCGQDQKELVYIKVVHEGKEKFICARCLPFLIHGAH